MNDASYIRAHRVNGSVWSKPKMVNAQFSRALVHNFADDVHFHLQKKNKDTKVVKLTVEFEF